MSKREPKPPITSLLKEPIVFLTFFFDNDDMCLTSLLANEISHQKFITIFYFFHL